MDEEVRKRLQELVDGFDPNECIDFAYWAVEELESILDSY
jgi:hypothetical protein